MPAPDRLGRSLVSPVSEENVPGGADTSPTTPLPLLLRLTSVNDPNDSSDWSTTVPGDGVSTVAEALDTKLQTLGSLPASLMTAASDTPGALSERA